MSLYAFIILNFMVLLRFYWTSDNVPVSLFKNFNKPVLIILYIIHFLALGGLPPFSLFWLKLLILKKLFNTTPILIYLLFSLYLVALLYFYLKYLQLILPLKNLNKWKMSIIMEKVKSNTARELSNYVESLRFVYITIILTFNTFIYYNDFVLLFQVLLY